MGKQDLHRIIQETEDKETATRLLGDRQMNFLNVEFFERMHVKIHKTEN